MRAVELVGRTIEEGTLITRVEEEKGVMEMESSGEAERGVIVK